MGLNESRPDNHPDFDWRLEQRGGLFKQAYFKIGIIVGRF